MYCVYSSKLVLPLIRGLFKLLLVVFLSFLHGIRARLKDRKHLIIYCSISQTLRVRVFWIEVTLRVRVSSIGSSIANLYTKVHSFRSCMFSPVVCSFYFDLISSVQVQAVSAGSLRIYHLPVFFLTSVQYRADLL